MDVLNFQPDPVARSLAGGRTYTLGILLPELTNPFFSLLMSGIEQGVREVGYDLLIYLTSAARLQRGRPVYPLNEHNTDGLIVYTDSLLQEEILRLHQSDFPLVILFRSPPNGLAISSITIENVEGAAKAVDHLINDAGKKRIAFLQELTDNEDSIQREKGYRTSLANHGIEVDEMLIANGDFINESCQPIIQQWLEQPEPIDAIFADCDRLAIQVVDYLNQANIQIPQHVAVVGFDNVTMAKYLNPSLTTVHSPIIDAGKQAIGLLVQQIETGKTESIHLSTELMVRNSTVVQR